MAAVPVVINGVFMPKGKSATDKPIPAVFLGYATIAGVEPEHPIVIPPDPVDPPVVDPPPTTAPPNLAVVIKPAPATGGWGLAANDQTLQWFFVPGQSGAGPKK
jgi:hypothetical protein